MSIFENSLDHPINDWWPFIRVNSCMNNHDKNDYDCWRDLQFVPIIVNCCATMTNKTEIGPIKDYG